MNKIPALIKQVFKHNGCVLLQMQCAFGILHSLVLEPCEFEVHNEVMATFKENEIILSQHTFLSHLNTFEAEVTDIQTSGFFMRFQLMPITQDTLDSTRSQDSALTAPCHIETQNITPIYALFPSLAHIEISQNKTCKWHIPSSHILLERRM